MIHNQSVKKIARVASDFVHDFIGVKSNSESEAESAMIRELTFEEVRDPNPYAEWSTSDIRKRMAAIEPLGREAYLKSVYFKKKLQQLQSALNGRRH